MEAATGPAQRPTGTGDGTPSRTGSLQTRLAHLTTASSLPPLSAAGARALVAGLHAISPEGRAVRLTTRPATLEEAKTLLRGDESDEIAENARAHWDAHPEAYYRWDVDAPMGGEPGIVTDMARQTFYAAHRFGGARAEPEELPVVVVVNDGGRERIAGFALLVGEVHFHTDSELRQAGWKGLGTALVAHFLEKCLNADEDAVLESVNGSSGFYEKLGFRYCDPDTTPSTVTSDPHFTRFPMWVPKEELSTTLRALAARDAKAVATVA